MVFGCLCSDHCGTPRALRQVARASESPTLRQRFDCAVQAVLAAACCSPVIARQLGQRATLKNPRFIGVVVGLTLFLVFTNLTMDAKNVKVQRCERARAPARS